MNDTAVPRAPVSARTARNVLIVLTFVNLFNYIDRYIVPAIAQTLQTVLHLTFKQIGLLGTGFIVVYAIVAPQFGKLGDSRHRPRLIALGVGIWSVATVLGGLAWGFVSLLVARAIMGVGEAAYGSIAPSLLADAFPRARRGRVFAIFFAAIPIGSALGFIIATQMDAHFGWRSAFFVAGVPGLVLALLLLGMPEVPRGTQDADDDAVLHHASTSPRVGWSTYAGLLANRTYLVTVLGYAAYTFALGALAFWMEKFLISMRGVPETAAGKEIGAIAVLTGIVGTFAGGWLGDHLLKYTSHAYLLFSGIVTLLAVPFVIVALTATQPLAYLGGLVIAELLIFASTGPVNSAIINAVAPNERATAMAFSILWMHLLGDAPSPWIVGWIADSGTAAGRAEGPALQHGLMVLPVAFLIAGIIWMAGGLRREARGA
jgi:MFS family permease